LGLAIIKGVKVAKENEELSKQIADELKVYEGLQGKDIDDFEQIQSYRQMYKQMGVDWHSRRPSPEALLRRVAQGKDLYQVNTCVDAYNLIVMRYRVSIGTFDLDQIKFPTTLEIGQGGEKILLLGNDGETEIKPGEVFYQDQAGSYNLDFNYRDAQRTAVTEKTTNLLINIDGVYDINRAQVERSLKETLEIITKYCGGEIELTGVVMAK